MLSGGGARGAAHIGVLKVLEAHRVPVDAIAGTSMGAVVGGLYASGLSAADIERVMTSVDWEDAFRDRPARKDLNFRRKLEDQNFLVKFPLGLKGRRFRLPRGLVQGQKLTQILRALTLPVAQIQSFDDLAIPFRAIATDIVTGDRVVLDRGDLTTAMRASLSAPGVFAPVETEGRMLVDGGLSSNLPIDVAREMGVDVLIVVDCGFPLLERGKLDSVATVSNQMLAILIRHNTTAQRKTLTDRDVVIDPALGDFPSLDFTDHARAMKIGEEAARGAAERLAALGLTDPEFARVVAARTVSAHRSADHRFRARGAGIGAVCGRHRCAVLRPGRQGGRRHGTRQTREYAVRPGQPRDLRLPVWCRRSGVRRRAVRLRPVAHHAPQLVGS